MCKGCPEVKSKRFWKVLDLGTWWSVETKVGAASKKSRMKAMWQWIEEKMEIFQPLPPHTLNKNNFKWKERDRAELKGNTGSQDRLNFVLFFKDGQELNILLD